MGNRKHTSTLLTFLNAWVKICAVFHVCMVLPSTIAYSRLDRLIVMMTSLAVPAAAFFRHTTGVASITKCYSVLLQYSELGSSRADTKPVAMGILGLLDQQRFFRGSQSLPQCEGFAARGGIMPPVSICDGSPHGAFLYDYSACDPRGTYCPHGASVM